MKNKTLCILVILTGITGLHGQVNYYNTSVSGTAASAIGINSSATGNASFASGFASETNAYYTTSMGFYASSNYTKAIAIGSMVKSNVYKSIVLGSGSFPKSIYLENNVKESLMVGFNSKYPTLLVVEPEGQDQNYSKTGRIGVGNLTRPLAKLHLKADDGEEAAFFIEPNNWDAGDAATLTLGKEGYGISNNNYNGMVFGSVKDFLFKGEHVGINVINPQYALEVNGGIFTKEFRLYSELNHTQIGFVLTSDEEGNASWQNPNNLGLWQQHPNNTDIYFNSGEVAIGCENTYGYALTVNGSILTDEVMVKHPDQWYDCVFEENYELRSLDELQAFLSQHKHLPDIPSEKTILKEGFSLGEMDGLLLKKIEELSLYIIQQDQRIHTLEQLLERPKEMEEKR